MKRLTGLAWVGAAFLLASAVACSPGDGGSGEEDLALGRRLFRQNCATCHGMRGEGMDRLGKALVGNEMISVTSTSSLVEFLAEGRPAAHPDNTRGIDMPPRGGNPGLSDDDLAAIVAYLRTLE
jgi:mono/diheme cytochrome c family protein